LDALALALALHQMNLYPNDKPINYRPVSDKCHFVSLPAPGTNWADWSDMMGREMYLQRALARLDLEMPCESDI
jgi:hypothetical protein